jgi:XTP/dITP diphosphohydrolase
MELCFASNNEHKLSEIRPLLEPDFRILSLSDIGCFEELEETQNTLEGNSFQKADYVFRKYNVPCIADDSGLEVDALNGEPGVYSARYAGPQRNSDDNMNLLLKKLSDNRNRTAQFRTIITLVGFGPTQFFEGIVEGEIVQNKRGTKGFGYDPIFQPSGFDKTFAEMDLDEKNKFSHRARAIQKLIAFLKNNNVV